MSEHQEYRVVITGEAEVTKAKPQPDDPDAEPVQDNTDEGES